MNPSVASYEVKTDSVVSGTTATPSQIELRIIKNEIGGRRQKVGGKSVRVRVVDAGTTTDATNATIAAGDGVTTVTTVTSDKELIIKEPAAAYAGGTLTISGVASDAETVTIGTRVYEFDTRASAHVSGSNVRVNANSYATKSQGTLRLDTIPTALDTMTIGTRTFIWVASGAGNAAGEISIGANLAAAEANMLAAIAGTDGFNTAHTEVTMAAGTHTPATATLTLADVVADGETVTIGNKTYTFQTSLTNVDGNVLIGASAAASLDNLKAAVNLSAGAGTTYALATTAHTQVTATTNTDTTQVFSATVLAASNGNATIQNALASTETLAASGNQFGAATFSGAIDKFVITALAGGVGGDLLATTETFTATNNTFDAATLGTTTAGVSCTAANAVTALVAAINGDASRVASAADGAGNTVVLTALTSGATPNTYATTETMANASFGAVTLTGGLDDPNGTLLVVLTDATAESFDLIVSDNVVADGVPFPDVRLTVTHAAP